MTNKMMLQTENLCVGYGKTVTLRDVTVGAARGQFICLTGRNGSGKSTLIRTLSGLSKPLSGNIIIGGEAMHRQSAWDLARHTGLVLTKRPLVEFMQVREMVAMGRYPYASGFAGATAADTRIVDTALEQTGITHLAESYINEISDGECQKAMIARVLAQETPIVILDEPTAFLDHESKIQLFVLLRHLADHQAKTIICATHDLELAAGYAHTFWRAADGYITTPDTLVSRSG